ncbi:PP0621 family protein [Undibacterium sp. TJN25]|uniref:PP0621 family protein n=1 Tax=Undibacterium sp. TJN25 TaxID=3413056 RepID=UPI003BF41FB1
MRILFWLALFVVVILALKKKVQTVASPAREQQAPPPSAGKPARDAEAMVCCAACQVYIPASEAVYKGQQVYCSTEHAEQAGAR